MSPAFKYKTDWVVITGAPSSGKTSVIKTLAQRGLATQGEVARELIELSLSRGRALADIRRDAKALQNGILGATLAREMGLEIGERIFMDRGLPDSITYLKLAGLDGLEAVTMSALFQYHAVFIFDRLPIVKDNVRTEDEDLAHRIDMLLEADYKSVGYAPLRVPVMSIEERTDFVLKNY